MPRFNSKSTVVWQVVCWPLAIGLIAIFLTGSQSAFSQDASGIDAWVEAGYRKAGIEPAGLCSDQEFVRRGYLDLAGRIPTVGEREAFLQDPSPDKRTALIDRILQSEDYVQNFSDTFDTLLMGRAPGGKIAERKKLWRPYLENVFRQNRAWDLVAREILLARPQSDDQAGSVWFLYERNDNAQAIAEAVAPAFFGIRIDCAQCHDHMVASEIHQQHYWGLVAFFNRSKNQKTKLGPRVGESAIGGFSDFANIQGSSYPNLLTFYQGKTIDEARPEKDAKQEDSEELYVASPKPDEPRIPKFSRREKFVEEILAGHPMLAQAFVNRLWAMLMGRGVVHPFDQMDSAHPASHPELLDSLAREFIDSGYDIRQMVRRIALSRTYQLSSLQPSGVQDPATFAWAIEKPLTAEQLVRSMQIALFQRSDNEHSILADLRDRIPEVLPETVTTDIADALFLTNNPKMQQLLLEGAKPDGLIAQLASQSDSAVAVDQLFVAVLGRQPEEAEREAVLGFVRKRSEGQANADPKAAWQSALWAVLTSAEFRFNH